MRCNSKCLLIKRPAARQEREYKKLLVECLHSGHVIGVHRVEVANVHLHNQLIVRIS